MKKSPVWRAVLDSNVWIDILVFDDPDSRPIRAALEAGTLEALIDARCLKELTYVLDYPQFVRFAVDKAQALETVARLSRLVETEPLPEDAPPLPKCKDRDDQKFSNWRMQARRTGWYRRTGRCSNLRNAPRVILASGSPSRRRS